MPLFDTLCITFGTAGTGGFSIKSDGCAGYTMLQQGIITTFMILFGVNFTFYFCILKKKIKQVSSMTEVWAYLAIIAASILRSPSIFPGDFRVCFRHFTMQHFRLDRSSRPPDSVRWISTSGRVFQNDPGDTDVCRSLCGKYRRRYQSVTYPAFC